MKCTRRWGPRRQAERGVEPKMSSGFRFSGDDSGDAVRGARSRQGRAAHRRERGEGIEGRRGEEIEGRMRIAKCGLDYQ